MVPDPVASFPHPPRITSVGAGASPALGLARVRRSAGQRAGYAQSSSPQSQWTTVNIHEIHGKRAGEGARPYREDEGAQS